MRRLAVLAIVPYACWMEHGGSLDAARAAREARLRSTLAALALFPASP